MSTVQSLQQIARQHLVETNCVSVAERMAMGDKHSQMVITVINSDECMDVFEIELAKLLNKFYRYSTINGKIIDSPYDL